MHIEVKHFDLRFGYSPESLGVDSQKLHESILGKAGFEDHLHSGEQLDVIVGELRFGSNETGGFDEALHDSMVHTDSLGELLKRVRCAPFALLRQILKVPTKERLGSLYLHEGVEIDPATEQKTDQAHPLQVILAE